MSLLRRTSALLLTAATLWGAVVLLGAAPASAWIPQGCSPSMAGTQAYAECMGRHSGASDIGAVTAGDVSSVAARRGCSADLAGTQAYAECAARSSHADDGAVTADDPVLAGAAAAATDAGSPMWQLLLSAAIGAALAAGIALGGPRVLHRHTVA